MRVAAAVAEMLKREGVEFLIGYPVNPIIEAAAEADIRTIIVRQERTGLHMADAVSRVTVRRSDRRLRDAARTRDRKRLWRRGPGVRRFGADRGAAGRVSAPPRQCAAQLQCPPQLSARHEIGRAGDRCCRRVPDAMRRAFTQVAQRTPAPGRWSRFPADLMQEEVTEPLHLPPGTAPAICAGPAWRSRRWRACSLRAERPVHLRRPGRALRQGLAAAA